MTNQSDYCRLYTNDGSAYFNFAANQLYANTTLQVNTTANIGSTLTIGGNLSGGANVCKRASFTFTPTRLIVALGVRYVYDINLSSYISSITGPLGNAQYIFRIHIWSTSGDFGDSANNVESMSYIIYYANWGGGVKVRMYQLANSSNGSFISTSTWPIVYYNGWNGTGGGSQKFCVIENISSY